MRCSNCGDTTKPLGKTWFGYICAYCEQIGAMEKYGLISKKK